MDPFVGSSQSAPDCIINPPCHYRGKYRKEDGTCNNELKSLWGSAGFPMEKLVTPAYEDGIWAPRLKGKDGSLLASPRAISQTLFSDVDRPHPKYNLLLMQFGQWIAHDVTQSSSIKMRMYRINLCWKLKMGI
jgi:peroxidase